MKKGWFGTVRCQSQVAGYNIRQVNKVLGSFADCAPLCRGGGWDVVIHFECRHWNSQISKRSTWSLFMSACVDCGIQGNHFFNGVTGHSWTLLGVVGVIWINPWESKCRIRLPCANARAISQDGAWRLEWTLFSRIIALKDSKPSVANNIAGPKRRIWSGRWTRMWNFGLLNQSGFHCAVHRRKLSISCCSKIW